MAKDKQRCTVLLTAINSSPVLNMIKFLRAQEKYEVKIIGCDIVDYTAGRLMVDAFYKIPGFKSESLLSVLQDICNKEKVDIIIPNFEPELRILSENREKFKDIKIALPSQEAVKLCLDKEKTLQLFSENGIPAPKIYQLENVQESDFPLFLKPKVGNASKGIKVIKTLEDLQRHYDPREHVLCEFLQGEEFTIDVYCKTPGVATCMLARKRLEIVDGMATRAETFVDEKLLDYCRSIVSLIGYEGMCCIQCIHDQDYKFFEINPRVGGSSNLTFEAGYNMPLYVLDEFFGNEIQLPEKTKNLYLVKYYENTYWDKNN